MKENENNEVLQGNSLENEENLAFKLEIRTFTSDSLGSLRTAIDEMGRPVLCLKDACSILDIKNPSDAKKRLKPQGIIRISKKTQGDNKFHNFLYITEDNFYRLIFQSRKTEAIQFMDWVTEVVLPTIRKYGRFDVKTITGSPEAAIAFLDSYRELEVKNKILESINAESENAREYVRRMTDSGVLTDLFDVPKKLKIKGVDRVMLLSFLRNNDVLNENNYPNQLYIDKGWFRVIDGTYLDKKAGKVSHTRIFVYKTGINGIRKLLDSWVGKK